MAAGSLAAKTNGVVHNQEPKEVLEYRKIVKLRDEIFADNHPRIKITSQAQAKGKTQTVGSLPSKPASRAKNGVHNSPQALSPSKGHSKGSNGSAAKSASLPDQPPSNERGSTAVSASSGIDPIFLTVPEVVIRAELQQKRRRIERLLEEQFNQRRVVLRQKAFDQEALPDFDVTEVLRKARELVKPFKPVENNSANRTASSDSFDERTFYSSQMNESTTEEADDSGKFRPNKACRPFLDGHCRHGDACTFSHDPVMKGKVQADGSKTDNSGANADEQANSRRKLTPPTKRPNKDQNPNPKVHLDRIAQLEEQLRNLKSQTKHAPHDAVSGNPKESRNTHEEPAYSPPDVGDVEPSQHDGRAVRRAVESRQVIEPVERRTSANLEVNREYGQHDRSPPSNEVRVIRNHITSPAAPQPARVSPLAVAKVPHIYQGSRIYSENLHQARISDGEVSARQSPHTHLHLPSSRKRRREIDSYDRARNVVQRLEAGSPHIRVKEEPVSPPPLRERTDVWQPLQRQDVPRPIYVDSDNLRYRDREPAILQPRAVEQPPRNYFTTEERPVTPVARRVLSRNGHHVEVHNEQDFRRRMSARQVRLPRSPIEQFSVSQPSSARAASQVYIPQSAVVPSRLPRASVQPLPISYIEHNRSLSPLPRARFSPIRGSAAMAPPGRVIVDQYGHKYLEAPPPADRQASVIPINRQNEFVPRYEQSIPRQIGIRDSQVVNLYDEGQYIRRGQSPLSPHYVEYQSAPTYRQVLDREVGQSFNEEAYIPHNDNVRVVEYSGPRSTGHYEEIIRPHEGVMRTQSVRPTNNQYEAPRERVTRIQSVRPEQDRILSLERRRDLPPQATRHVSVRADGGFARPIHYPGVERPKYQYAIETQEPRYVENHN